MNIYIVITSKGEYIAAFGTEARAKEFIAACNMAHDYIVRVDWLIGMVE